MLFSALIILGLLASLAGAVWFVVEAFRTHVLWGFGVFVPFVGLGFLAMHWSRAWKPFLVSLGAVAVVVGAALGRPGGMDAYRKAYAESYAAAQSRLGMRAAVPKPEAATTLAAVASALPVVPSDAQRAAEMGKRYNEHVAELQTQCTQLRAERKTMHPGTAEESMYTAHLLSYNRSIVEAQEERRQLDTMNQRVLAAARQADKAAAAGKH